MAKFGSIATILVTWHITKVN